MRELIFLVLLILTFNTIISQEFELDSTNIYRLGEVVVSGQYTPKSEKNSIYKIRVINAKTIKFKATSSLTELLRHELNLDFSFNPVFGSSIDLNGVSKENIKILVDGVPLIGRVNGVLNLNQISLTNIERVEVIEGPVSVFYGTNAMGGTINLITEKTQKEYFSGSISGYYESINAKKTEASIGTKFDKNSIKASTGYYKFNGLNTNKENLRSYTWPNKYQYFTNLKYIRDLGNFKLRFSSDFSKELVHILGEIEKTKATDIDYTTKRFDNSLNFQGKLNNDNYIDITTSYLNYDRFDTTYTYNSNENSSELIENNPNENGNYFDSFFVKGQIAKSKTESVFNYVVGLEFEADFAKGNRIINEKQNIQNTSFFSSINYRFFDNLVIQPALRYTYNSNFKSLWSPALNLKYRINANNTLRMGYAKGFRAPSIKELFLDWTPTFGPFTYIFSGNESLKLETSNSYNLYYTFKYNFKEYHNLEIEPSFFYNEIKNLIGLSEMVNFERHYINLSKTETLNTSLQMKYKSKANLQINLGFSYLGRFNEYTKTFKSDKFHFTPSFNSLISYIINPIDLQLNAFYKYTGKCTGHYIEEVAGINVLRENTRNGFNNFDFSIYKAFFNNNLSLLIGAKNIFDVTDIETLNQIGVAHDRDIQLWGRSLFIKTSFDF